MDVSRHCADTVPTWCQPPPCNVFPAQGLQLLGGAACLEDALSIAALGLEDIHAARHCST